MLAAAGNLLLSAVTLPAQELGLSLGQGQVTLVKLASQTHRVVT